MNTRPLRVLSLSLGIAFLAVPLHAQSGKVRIMLAAWVRGEEPSCLSY